MSSPSPSLPSLVVYYPSPETPLAPADLEEIFGRLGRNDALWGALMQLLQERLANATVDAANGDLNAPGRLQEILGLQAQLSAFRRGREKPKAR